MHKARCSARFPREQYRQAKGGEATKGPKTILQWHGNEANFVVQYAALKRQKENLFNRDKLLAKEHNLNGCRKLTGNFSSEALLLA